MKINQFGGGLFEFHSDLGGGLLFSLKKCQNGGSVNIFHQIWPNYRENLLIFCFFWGGSENFSRKNFFREGDLGGVYTELLNFGGGLDGIGRKWGGSAFGARRAPNWYTPPPGMFMTPSLSRLYQPISKGRVPKKIVEFSTKRGATVCLKMVYP